MECNEYLQENAAQSLLTVSWGCFLQQPSKQAGSLSLSPPGQEQFDLDTQLYCLAPDSGTDLEASRRTVCNHFLKLHSTVFK